MSGFRRRSGTQIAGRRLEEDGANAKGGTTSRNNSQWSRLEAGRSHIEVLIAQCNAIGLWKRMMRVRGVCGQINPILVTPGRAAAPSHPSNGRWRRDYIRVIFCTVMVKFYDSEWPHAPHAPRRGRFWTQWTRFSSWFDGREMIMMAVTPFIGRSPLKLKPWKALYLQSNLMAFVLH